MSMFYCQSSARLRGPGARPHRDDRREPGLSWGEPRRRPAGGEPRNRPAGGEPHRRPVGGEPQRRPAGGEAEPSRNTQVHATTGPNFLRISFTFEESVVVTSSNLINFSIDRYNVSHLKRRSKKTVANWQYTINAIANGQQEHEHQHQHEANTGTSTSNQDDGDIDSESSTDTNSGAESSSDVSYRVILSDWQIGRIN